MADKQIRFYIAAFYMAAYKKNKIKYFKKYINN